jgi:signal recognition particle receptor subunit alpha
MIDSVTVFSRSGLVLYHLDVRPTPTAGASTTSSSSSSLDAVCSFVSGTMLDPARCAASRRAGRRATVLPGEGGEGGEGGGAARPAVALEWEEMARLQDAAAESGSGSGSASGSASGSYQRDWIAVAARPEVVAGAAPHGWVGHFLRTVLREYGLYHDAALAREEERDLEEKAMEEEGERGGQEGGGQASLSSASPLPPWRRAAFAPPSDPFHATCRAALRRSEELGRRAAAGRGGGGGGRRQHQRGGGIGQDDDDLGDGADDGSDDGGDEEEDGGAGARTGEGAEPEEGVAGSARDRAAAAAAAAAARRGGRGGTRGGPAPRTSPRRKGKEARNWHDGGGKVTAEAMGRLDRSAGDSGGADGGGGVAAAAAEGSAALAEARAAYLPSDGEVPSWEEEDVLLDDDMGEGLAASGSSSSSSSSSRTAGGGGWGSSLTGLLDQLSGNRVLSVDDLARPLDDMRAMLASKNVANEVAAEICDGVRDRLVGKRMATLGRVKTAVRHALEGAVEKVLRPAAGREVDVLRSVKAKRERGAGGLLGGLLGSSSSTPNRPYTIVMVGINGVGKSTSLAKIAYYLKASGCSPLLAACDTFRSGAVEQLSVHAKCLDVPLYHKGYAKDPSAVARAAIDQASQDGNDVVLVDTAGRMQNNVPLMKALSKLVVENDPDLVLFVCEALVGNDGMDQLQMFDKALRSGGHRRRIDGVVLTKFDTVSDKVGAALTLTHVTGSPVVFIGTGQKYNHLKKLSVQSVIKSLFS